MASQSEGVNPLRPYYIPPTIGDPAEPALRGSRLSLPHTSNATTTTYSHRARDIFADLDYKDYIAEPSPSVVQSAKDVVDELVWRYASVLMAQPFEVAKTLLQVQSQDCPAAPATPGVPEPDPSRGQRAYDYGSQPNPFADYDSDPDEPSYFTPSAFDTSRRFNTLPRGHRPPSPPVILPAQETAPRLTGSQLLLQKPGSILEVISQLWQKEGAWGVFKGTNASFLYNFLQSLLESWSRSLLSALFNVPDLGLKDDVERLVDIASPYPWASLFVAAAAAVATGLVLSPLDLIRTRLIVTPTKSQPRRVLSILRALPSYVCPPVLVLPTVLHSLIHPLLTLSTPLVLRTRFLIDKDASPVAFSVAKFCSSSLALFVKLPLETVLRRGQVAVMSSPTYVQAVESASNAHLDAHGHTAAMDAILPLGKYDGVLGTMMHIVWEEGQSPVRETKSRTRGDPRKNKVKVAETVYRRGQGMEGLWRGWKVSWWGLVGLWTAAAVGGGGDGEF